MSLPDIVRLVIMSCLMIRMGSDLGDGQTRLGTFACIVSVLDLPAGQASGNAEVTVIGKTDLRIRQRVVKDQRRNR